MSAAAEVAQPPIHEVILDFARPFLEIGQASSPAALEYAALIWDLCVDGLSSAQIAETLHLEAREAQLVDAFVRRKRLFFDQDRRYVVESRLL
ncbi:MAG: hypothetical protein ACTHU0_10645 [Kofleriaceae bacterium]